MTWEILNQGWLGAAIGALGLLFGIYQIARRTTARIAYQFLGQRLIEGRGGMLPSDVSVLYKGTEVQRVSLTQIVIWNDGRAPVRGEDIVRDDPIGFSFDDATEILSIETPKSTRAANKFEIRIHPSKENCLLCHFSFLDRRDGALIRVLHNGSQTRPDPFGAIVGIPEGLVSLGRIRFATIRRGGGIATSGPLQFAIRAMTRIITSAAFTMCIAFLMLGLAFFGDWLAIFGVEEVPPFAARVVFGILGAVYVAMSWVNWGVRRRFPPSLTPDEP